MSSSQKVGPLSRLGVPLVLKGDPLFERRTQFGILDFIFEKEFGKERDQIERVRVKRVFQKAWAFSHHQPHPAFRAYQKGLFFLFSHIAFSFILHVVARHIHI